MTAADRPGRRAPLRRQGATVFITGRKPAELETVPANWYSGRTRVQGDVAGPRSLRGCRHRCRSGPRSTSCPPTPAPQVQRPLARSPTSISTCCSASTSKGGAHHPNPAAPAQRWRSHFILSSSVAATGTPRNRRLRRRQQLYARLPEPGPTNTAPATYGSTPVNPASTATPMMTAGPGDDFCKPHSATQTHTERGESDETTR